MADEIMEGLYRANSLGKYLIFLNGSCWFMDGEKDVLNKWNGWKPDKALLERHRCTLTVPSLLLK